MIIYYYNCSSMNKITLPPLPYSYDVLEPIISKEIVELHHDKHQAGYVNTANELIEKNIWNKDTIRSFSFNYNGAKLHEVYWENMIKPQENNLPPAGMFTDFDKFKEEFSAAAISVEGSGWAVWWKTAENDLIIGQLEKHNLLGLNGAKPILVLDVWEHSYYLQYKNNRAEYVKNWWQLINWEDIQRRFDQK